MLLTARHTLITACLAGSFALPLSAQDAPTTQMPVAQTSASPAAKRLITPADIKAWNSMRQTILSNDGRWFAYLTGPAESDAQLVIRGTANGANEQRVNVGDGGGSVVISGDSKWVGYIVAPPKPPERAARGGGAARTEGEGSDSAKAPPRDSAKFTSNKFVLQNLTTGAKKEFERIRRFSFNADRATWVALHGYGTAESSGTGSGPTGGAAGGGRGGAPGGGGGGSASGGPAPLLLYNLATGEMINMGVVDEYAFNDDGTWLAYTMETPDRVGNGVQLRNMTTAAVHSIENERLLYKHLAWVDSSRGLSVMRGRIDDTAKDTTFSIELFTQFGSKGPGKRVLFDPSTRTDFPSGWKLASERAPRYAKDMSAIFFGLREATKDTRVAGARSAITPGAPGMGGTVNQGNRGATGTASDSLPTLILWHAKDDRLQSQQIVQEQADRAFNYMSAYRIPENRFVRLTDDSLRTITITTGDRYAYGIDNRAYQREASYSGRNFQDIYRVNLATGDRTKIMEKKPTGAMTASPDGRRLLYWGTDANWWILDLETGRSTNITQGLPVSFVDSTNDYNNLYPPAERSLGWSRDGNHVLLDDGWDIWKVPTVQGRGSAINLTVDGRARQVHYQRLYSFTNGRVEPTLPGIDLSKPLYFGTYGEWTKKEGLSRVDPNGKGATEIFFEDARFNIIKARDADVYAYTRQTFTEYPNWWVFNPGFRDGYRITDANPQMSDLAWSSGTRLVDYVSDKGSKLQGTMYLPANYEPGRKYPMIVTIYERRSQNKNIFASPSETRAPDPTIYTNQGYIVFDPDIVYVVNDPGMSAVWSVIPAVKAAIATGAVDSARIGLWGHSWGGYQTAFLVTQTDMFAGAIAGAPLTDMISMYSSVYWNSGGSNQAIFEASQGRFKGSFVDNTEAYIRNSPAFFAKNVKTPLLIMHNDKDGAVDFNQGITFFNTLRQLDKEVIMLEYVGENHGLARPVNQKDYAGRMTEWFDYTVKDLPAAEWIRSGVPRLKMEEHLKSRKETVTKPVVF